MDEGGALLLPIPGAASAGVAPPLPAAWAVIVLLVAVTNIATVLSVYHRVMLPRLWAHYGGSAVAMYKELRSRGPGPTSRANQKKAE